MPYHRKQPLGRVPSDTDEDFAPAGYVLDFEENFTSFVATPTGINAGIPCWRTAFADGSRFHGTEEQIYADSAYLGLGLNPFEVSGSPLTLKIKMTKLTAPQQAALPNNPNTAVKPKYYSGVLTDANLSLAFYSYWVIRLRAPVGPADQWPTFWQFPYIVPFVEPSPYEEYDTMEGTPNNTQRVYTIRHYPVLNTIAGGFPRVETTDWNVYSLRRISTGCEFRVNGVITGRAVFSPAYYVYNILNYAARAGGLSNEGILPNSLEVAWIRRYRPPISAAFAETWDGANGAAWNATRWATAESTGTSLVDTQARQGRLLAQGGAYARTRVLSLSGALANFDLTTRFIAPIVGEQYHALNFRASGGWAASDNGDPQNGYRVDISLFPASPSLNFIPVVAGTRGTTVSVAKAMDNLGPWHLRVQAIGSAIKIKAWQSAEPGAWDIEVTNGSHASGVISMASFNGADSVARSILWDNLVVI